MKIAVLIAMFSNIFASELPDDIGFGLRLLTGVCLGYIASQIYK